MARLAHIRRTTLILPTAKHPDPVLAHLIRLPSKSHCNILERLRFALKELFVAVYVIVADDDVEVLLKFRTECVNCGGNGIFFDARISWSRFDSSWIMCFIWNCHLWLR
jgi:hypothetical protein